MRRRCTKEAATDGVEHRGHGRSGAADHMSSVVVVALAIAILLVSSVVVLLLIRRSVVHSHADQAFGA